LLPVVSILGFEDFKHGGDLDAAEQWRER